MEALRTQYATLLVMGIAILTYASTRFQKRIG